ncbi:MAG TPA: acyltransferase [Gemmatimonadaceae bacterium]|nr:acyltransferase [Gemmatimonadaceae bacterium]
MTADGPSSAQPARIDALDGLRAIAILCVICCHAPPYLAALPTRIVDTLTAGWVGVDVFFVLSGFLISGILLDARGDGAHAPSGYYRAFYARRALRIFPIYYAFLAYIFFVRRFTAPHGEWWYWAYLTNVLFAWHGWGLQPHLWSLAVEEQFYLFWPAAIRLVRRSSLRTVCWGIILASIAARIVVAVAWGWTPAYVLTICRMDEFAVGALLALSLRAAPSSSRSPKSARTAASASMLVLLGLAVTGALAEPTALRRSVGGLVTTVLTAACIWLVVAPGGSERLARVLSHPVLRSIGKYSYAMYVLHYRAGEWLEARVLDRYAVQHPIAIALVDIPATIALSWAVAWVTWQILEKPLLSLKRFVPMPSGALPQAASSQTEAGAARGWLARR